MKNADIKDTRILEAFDYIDPKYIAEVAESLKLKSVRTSTEVPKMTWRTPFKHWKQFVALAACLILLAFASPIVNYVVEAVRSFAAGWGSGTTEESSDIFENEQTEETTAERQYVYGAYLNPIKNLEPLPRGLLEEIDSKSKVGFSSFNMLNRGITFSDRYLGYIGEYYVFFNTSTGTNEEYMTADHTGELHVAGYDFYYSSPFSIILYKDGVTTNLKKAYDSGKITLDDVRKIYCRNNEYLRYFDPKLNFKDKVPVTEEEFNKVRELWISKYGESIYFASSFESTERIDYYFYGHVGENIIFHAGNPEYEGTNTRTCFTIEEYSFCEYSWAINIWVYNNGEILHLQDAYDRGLVTPEDLPTISYMNQSLFG